MPAPIDISGRRFGKLLVLRKGPDHVSASGKSRCPTWECVCDCGRQETLKDHQVPHNPTNAARSDARVACTECMSVRTCKACGKNFSSRQYKTACSEMCKVTLRRQIDIDCYHRKFAEDPELNKRRRAEKKSSQRGVEVIKQQERAQHEKRKARLKIDPDYREQLNAKARARYAQRAEEVQQRRREVAQRKSAEMTLDERAALLAARQDHYAAANRKYVERITPEVRRKEINDTARRMKERKAQKELERLQAQLLARLNKTEKTDE